MHSASATSTLRLGHLRQRLLAGWMWARLDHEIAAGLPIEECEARRERARQLLCPEQRRCIAAILRNVLDAAEASSRSGGSTRRADADAIVRSRDGLVHLIDLLRSNEPMAARAVALAELLACDRTGPLRSPRSAQAIAQELDEIVAANTP
jgi:hypothetical protein